MVTLQAQGEAGPSPELTSYPDDPAEAAGVARAVAAQIAQGTPPSQIAILFRTNGQSEAHESALADAGIPYLVRGGERFFARKEVRQAVLLLRGAARGDDGSKPLGELVRDVLGGAGWSERPPASGGAVRERWESLQALALLADDVVAAAPEARLPELVRELDERAVGAARADRAGRHAGLAARGQGPGVGLRLPRRVQRRADPDQHGRRSGRGGGGAPAAVRRPDPGPA